MRRGAEPRPIAHPEADALFGGLMEAKGIVAAVSGGPDSVCLMHLLAAWRERGETPPILVATVDHGLRPDSAGEALGVAAWGRGLGLRHEILTWEGEKPRTGVQEAAREERYRLLAEFAQKVGASHVVTGHSLDDQAETVTMRLVRGTGIGGLGGMRSEVARDGIMLARPLLGLAKARLIATCAAEGWPYLEDPANADPRFARARVRRQLMPLLARQGLTAQRLAVLAERARRDADALDAHASAVLAEISLSARAERDAGNEPRLALDGVRLRAEPDAILLRVAARAIAAVAGVVTPPMRLARFEARILGDLRGALRDGRPIRMNLGGALLDLSAGGRLDVRPEPPRRVNRKASSDDDAAAAPHSLGKGGTGA